MSNIQGKEVNKALANLNAEVVTITGAADIQLIYRYIKQQNKKISKLDK